MSKPKSPKQSTKARAARSTPPVNFAADNLSADLDEFSGTNGPLVSHANRVVQRVNAIASVVNNFGGGGGAAAPSTSADTDVICLHEDGERVLLTVVIQGAPTYPDRVTKTGR